MKRPMNVSLCRNGAPPPFRLNLRYIYVLTLHARAKPVLNAVALGLEHCYLGGLLRRWNHLRIDCIFWRSRGDACREHVFISSLSAGAPQRISLQSAG